MRGYTQKSEGLRAIKEQRTSQNEDHKDITEKAETCRAISSPIREGQECNDNVNAVTPDPVSPTENTTDIEEIEKEISEITDLEKKVHRLEEELEKHQPTDRTSMVANPDSPSTEERERHELTHANHKSWCKHCQKALAMRDKHTTKGKSKASHEYNQRGKHFCGSRRGRKRIYKA